MTNADNKKQTGIYIHIPFCISKCIYCDFLSFKADDETKERYVGALCEEIRGAGKECDAAVSSIFFGGGTPSILRSAQITQIMNAIKESFDILVDAEISIECNPGTVTKDKLETYRFIGINRISFGLQSADNKELKTLGRIHTYEQFEESYITARLAGFTNVNIDIMSAIPCQTTKAYENTLRRVIALKPEHISAYSLIVEEGTPLYDMVTRTKGRLLPSEEEDRKMYALTKEILGEAGYNRYEISNYAKPGYECRHNISYWIRKNYLGFGINAASLYDNVRFTNTSDIGEYIANPIRNRAELTTLTDKDAMEEFMFLGLRMMSGVSISEFEKLFKVRFMDIYGNVTNKHIEEGLLEFAGDRLRLTDIGIDISNYVMSDYIL